MLIWIILANAFRTIIMSVFGYRRVNLPRRAGIEGLEDPAVVKAYDRINQWPQFRLLRRMIAGELKKHHPNGLMVDIGCGPGYLVADIAKAFPHLYTVGVDISEEMMQITTHNLRSLGISERVSFQQGAVQKLPFEDNTADFVVSTLSLHHWPDPKQALEEVHRVLRPGGQFLIFDLRRDARRVFYWLLGFAKTFVVPAAIRRVNEPVGSALSSYTLLESEALLSGTPFQQLKIKPGLGWMFLWGCKS